MKKGLYVSGFVALFILCIWHTWQTVYVDIPRGGPFQIALQFLLINIIFAGSFWLFLDSKPAKHQPAAGASELRRWGWFFMGLLLIQIIWGGITSGLHGGHVYNTFPKMNQNWLPPELWIMEPAYINLFENASTAQWLHRIFGTLLGVTAIIMWIRTFQLNTSKTTLKWMLAIFSVILLQYAVGVFTLIYHVPTPLALLHQILTILLTGVTVGLLHHLHQPKNRNTL